MMQALGTETMVHNLGYLLNMQWSSFEDFQSRYDSSVDLNSFAKRASMLWQLDLLGHLLRKRLVDPEIVYTAGGTNAIWLWAKFKPIIDGYRKLSYGDSAYSDMEYLAREMWAMKRVRDPGFTSDRVYFGEGAFEKAFSSSPQ